MSKQEKYSTSWLMKSISRAPAAKVHSMTMTDATPSNVVSQNAGQVSVQFALKTVVETLMPTFMKVTKVSRHGTHNTFDF
jgi:uncharacterized protein with von Willebrand factor type A (vWA) domain